MSQVSLNFQQVTVTACSFPSMKCDQRLTQRQSQHAVELCALLVDETYGELTSVCLNNLRSTKYAHAKLSMLWTTLSEIMLVGSALTLHSGCSQSFYGEVD
jgi:hypothetical protein